MAAVPLLILGMFIFLSSPAFQGTTALETDVITALIAEASKISAPFSNATIGRLTTAIFGSGRAARSTDVILMNTSTKNFTLSENSCSHGGFTPKAFPDNIIEPHTSSIFGVQSHGLMTGCECVVKYVEVNNGTTSFKVHVVNPFVGDDWDTFVKEGTIAIKDTVGNGNNNDIRFIISDE